MSHPLILSVEFSTQRIRAVLVTPTGTVLRRHQRPLEHAAIALVSWIGGIYELYGAAVVVVGCRGRRWTSQVQRAVEQAGGTLHLLENRLVMAARRHERTLLERAWERRLSLQGALWNAQATSRGELRIPWTVRGWLRDRHTWAVHCLDAEDFDEVCRAGDEVPF